MGLASILTIAAALAIRIASHRILQVFADGITETMNAADEEWEESRLISAVKECQDLCSPDSIAHIMRAADQFAAGAEQHDDMTLLWCCGSNRASKSQANAWTRYVSHF